MKFRCVTIIALLCSLELLQVRLNAQGHAYITQDEGPFSGSGIDAKGIKYSGQDYPNTLPPWLRDCVKRVAPFYRDEDRLKHHRGVGLFRMTIDLKTGSVTDVVQLRSTGFASLDQSAIRALRKWQWRRGKWREVEVPVSFVMSGSSQPPAGSVPIPRP